MTDHPLPPGSVIGILGGGQLGRMLSVAAARLGYRCHVYEPGPAPAGDVAASLTHAPYEDMAALNAFAAAVDVVTYEFENVPATALDAIEAVVPIHPNRRALAISQDRVEEKTCLNELGLATAPWVQVDDEAGLTLALERLGRPAILKTRRLGYDGKGQHKITEDTALPEVMAPSVLEAFVDFTAEISVIVARGPDGAVAAFDPGLNLHRDGILRTTTVPCGLPSRVTTDAVLMASRIVTALDYVGVMGVELFVTPSGLLVNEIAPRVHNSGHWTQLGCAIDQFEQHIRAIAGLPLGAGRRHYDVVMENLIGDDMDRLPDLLGKDGVQIHLYGKAETRPGRKMGHVNRLA